MLTPQLLNALTRREPTLWINPLRDPAQPAFDPELVTQAARRFQRAGRLLARTVQVLHGGDGMVESPLLDAEPLRDALGGKGRWLMKADHRMPLAGSVKARGGFHEVLAYAESVALNAGWDGEDFAELADPRWRSLFGEHRLIVGSTGNLGISIGLLSRALGFNAQVHMSRDASEWKKQLLRSEGAEVIEHEGDYAAAVKAGRRGAASDEQAHFVDDERSELLFAGYAVAGQRLASQLSDQGVEVSTASPLLVYLPCGVGGAPGGITYGLKQVFGDAVHCWFAEPVESPSVLVQLAAGLDSPVSVYDVGLDNQTLADGLAVAQASMLAAGCMLGRLAGVFTVSDDALRGYLRLAQERLGERLEPSATAGFAGPQWLANDAAGRAWCEANRVDLHAATHILWSTGGGLVPDDVFARWVRGEGPA